MTDSSLSLHLVLLFFHPICLSLFLPLIPGEITCCLSLGISPISHFAIYPSPFSFLSPSLPVKWTKIA